jgi:exopolysaccharide/PEP-CTERM locus tyrosine autokinase
VGIIEKAAGRLAQSGTGASAPPQPARTVVQSQAEAHGSIPTEHKSTSKKVELNLAKLQEAGMVTPDGGRSSVAEEFRAIKRSLIMHTLEKKGEASKPGNLIMVTSALPGEGKTFCSINLAISIAMELDHTVLLIDADVARPSVLKRLGLKAEAGLMDILLERNLDVADVMLKTNIDTLSVLPSGAHHRHATELLASQAMNKLLHEIAHRYSDRIVIFDSPPLLVTTESRALATQMGQIVMVVEGEKTTQYALKNALRQIESCPNINLIYNKAKAFRGLENYGYYYS